MLHDPGHGREERILLEPLGYSVDADLGASLHTADAAFGSLSQSGSSIVVKSNGKCFKVIK